MQFQKKKKKKYIPKMDMVLSYKARKNFCYIKQQTPNKFYNKLLENKQSQSKQKVQL